MIFTHPAGSEFPTQKIKSGETITVSCAQGESGFIYRGLVPFKVEEIELTKMPSLPVKICMNLGNPKRTFQFQKIPNDGVGLARLEFIINQSIGLHPNACIDFDQLPASTRDKIAELSSAYSSTIEFYIRKLTEGLSTMAAAFVPKNVIMRFSDLNPVNIPIYSAVKHLNQRKKIPSWGSEVQVDMYRNDLRRFFP